MSKESVTSRRHRVAVVAMPGVPLFELAIPAEVFGIDRRELTPDWYEFALVGLDPDGSTIAHGLTVPAGGGIAELRRTDTVIVPACGDVHTPQPEPLLEALRAAHRRGARIAAICSGSFVLADAGLLDGRRATTHWMHADRLAQRHPAVTVDPTVLYVHDDVWTSAGSAAGLDLCLELVRRDHGAAIANQVARRIVTPPHRDGGQAQYIEPVPLAAGPYRDVQAWAGDNLAAVTVTDMARHAGISPRTLHRRFHRSTGTAPQTWLQRRRLETAAALLESSDLTVAAIARQVGLGTATNLRARFSDVYGTSPGRYRRTFRTSTPPGR